MPEVFGPVAKFCWSLTFGWRSSKTAGGGLGDETTIKWGFRPAQTVLPKRALLREGAVKGLASFEEVGMEFRKGLRPFQSEMG